MHITLAQGNSHNMHWVWNMVWLGLSCGFSTRLGQMFWLGVSQKSIGHKEVRGCKRSLCWTHCPGLSKWLFIPRLLKPWRRDISIFPESSSASGQQWPGSISMRPVESVMTRYRATSRGSTNTNNSPLPLQLRQQSVILFSTLPLDHCSTQWIVWQKQQGK